MIDSTFQIRILRKYQALDVSKLAKRTHLRATPLRTLEGNFINATAIGIFASARLTGFIHTALLDPGKLEILGIFAEDRTLMAGALDEALIALEDEARRKRITQIYVTTPAGFSSDTQSEKYFTFLRGKGFNSLSPISTPETMMKRITL